MIKKCNHYFAKLLADWSVSSSSGLHLNCLDGLRGVAIIMVVFFHGIYFNPKGNSVTILVGKLAGVGWMGVPIFFVISGFLISYPFFKGRLKTTAAWYPKGYATRRVLKIFPPFTFPSLS
jgi:peptidoglycan/LPS O-acetylase OafA/YrhL